MSHRSLIFTALAMFALAGLGPVNTGRADKVTYKTKAKRADIVLKEIADQTGLTIEFNDDAKLHYLVIDVNDVSVEDLLQKIATATSSLWNTAGTRWVLSPDERARREEQDAKNAERVERFKKAQVLIKKELDKGPMGDPSDEETEWRFFEGPDERALAQLSLLINPNDIASLESSGRIVYSTVPNRMQRRMADAQVSRILSTLVLEHNEYAAKRIKENEEMTKAMREAGELGEIDLFQEHYHMFESAPAKALVILELDGAEYGMPGDNANAKLVVYDQKGLAVVKTSISFSPEMYDRESYREFDPSAEGTVKTETPPVISDDDKTPITYSEDSKAFNAMTMTDDFELKMPDAVLAILRDPVGKDLLSLHISDSLLSVARAKKLNLVANVSDSEVESMFGNMFDDEPTMTTVGQAYRDLMDGQKPQGVVKDGWMLVRPRDPIAARNNRQDREVLKRLVDVAAPNQSVSLNTLATFALDSPHPMVNGMSFIYLFAFAPNSMQGLVGDTMSWDMLKFYGSLSPPQKNGLRQGGRLGFGQLSQQSRSIVTKMAFASDAGIKSAETMKKDEALPFFLSFMGGMSGSQRSTYAEEPTELMPNGLPGAGWVELAVAQETVATPEGGQSGWLFGIGSLGASEIAFFELMGELNLGQEESPFKVPDRIKLGSRENLKFHFWLSPEAGLAKTLLDDSFDKDAKAIDMGKIPDSFRAEINRRKQQIKDSPYGRMLGGIG